MARSTTAARRYAEAALELARRDGTLDAWLAELRLAVELVGVEEAATVVDNPAIAWDQRRAIITGLLGSRVGTPTRNLVLLLARRGRLAILPRVSDEFKRLVDREHGVVVANVTSAQPLEAADLAAIAERIRAMAGARVEVQAAVDPQLIGGLTVRVGDRLIDASVRGRLARLRASLVAGSR
jgi:F-type H+-transporting ATPase subunit delta